MEFRYRLPRIILGAPGSGSGKTTITCGILRLLQQKGYRPVAFKCGPDYIDPMFHREVLDIESRNLDLFFNEEEQVKAILADMGRRERADIAVMEGVMGYYDGIGGNTSAAGTFDLAKVTDTPAVLVVDAKGKSRSLVAEIKGFCQLEEDSKIRGVILNRVSPMIYPMLKAMIQKELVKLNLEVVGFVPVLADCVFKSRHLGLVTAAEIDDLEEKLDRLGKSLEETIDLEALMKLAESAGELNVKKKAPSQRCGNKIRVAVARDEAFCFYYEDNLELLRECGIETVDFSPLKDGDLPEDVNGLIFGGGYPELYGSRLEKNACLREEIRKKLKDGIPCLAECGGFMYLHEYIEDREGNSHKGVGFFEGGCVPKEKLVRFGYITLSPIEDTGVLRQGEKIRGHEFHYWESDDPGQAFKAEKPSGKRGWHCMRYEGGTLAGYPHLNYRSQPQLPERFADMCRSYKARI